MSEIKYFSQKEIGLLLSKLSRGKNCRFYVEVGAFDDISPMNAYYLVQLTCIIMLLTQF